jgi:hypothetical protein
MNCQRLEVERLCAAYFAMLQKIVQLATLQL